MGDGTLVDNRNHNCHIGYFKHLCCWIYQILHFHTTLTKISLNLKYYHLFVWLTAFISSTIPLIFNRYGYVINQNNVSECGIKDHLFELCIYGPVCFYILFAIGLLVYYCYQRYIFKKYKIGILSMQIVYFTIVFECISLGN